MEGEKFMSRKYKALITSCWILLFSCWLFTIITGQYITVWCQNEKFMALCNTIDNNKYIQLPLRFVMYYFNWLFIIYAVLKKPLKHKLWLWSIIISVFWVIKTTFLEYDITNYLDFFMIVPLILARPKKWYRAIIGIGLFFVFSLLCALVKIGLLSAEVYANIPSALVLIYSIDIYIICILYYINEMKGEENGQLVSIFQIKQKVESLKCSFRQCFSSSNRIYRFIRNWRNVKGKDIYFYYCSLVFFVITYGSILLIAILFNRAIEISICVVLFHLFRTFDEKTYHASNDAMCWLVSVISFSVITLLTLPLTQSILVCVCLSYILSKIMFLIRDYIDIEDLIEAHLLALNYLKKENKTNFFNLGTSRGNTIKEVFTLLKTYGYTDHTITSYNAIALVVYYLSKKGKAKQ